MNGVQTLCFQDTSDPRHFGTIESRWVQNVQTVRHQWRSVVPNCLQLGHFLTCDLSNNEQSYALYRCDRPTQRRAAITRQPSVTLNYSQHFKPCLERWNSALLNVESSRVLLVQTGLFNNFYNLRGGYLEATAPAWARFGHQLHHQ